MNSKRCPLCGLTTATRFALLPRNGGVACATCFVKETGHTPLPAGKLSSLAYYFGQYLEDEAVWQVSPGGSSGVTIRGVTIRGVTIRGITIRGVTVSQAR